MDLKLWNSKSCPHMKANVWYIFAWRYHTLLLLTWRPMFEESEMIMSYRGVLAYLLTFRYCIWSNGYTPQLSSVSTSQIPSPSPVPAPAKVPSTTSLTYTTLGSFSWDQDSDKLKVSITVVAHLLHINLASCCHLGTLWLGCAWFSSKDRILWLGCA